VETDKEEIILKCQCGEDLKLNSQGNVIPCATCMHKEFGYGADQGYTNGRNEAIYNTFMQIYSIGYSDCYEKLTGNTPPAWEVKHAADDSRIEHVGDIDY
jgi:hypothetical protein